MSQIVEKLKEEFSKYLDQIVKDQPELIRKDSEIIIPVTADSDYKQSLASNYIAFGLMRHQKLLKNLPGAFLAGGMFKNHFKRQAVRDLDIFFDTEANYGKALSYFNKHDQQFTLQYANDNCTAYRSKKSGTVFELIKTRFGTVEQIISVFDFTIVKSALSLNSEGRLIFTYHKDFFEHLMTNKLVLVDEPMLPVNTLQRTWKYAAYGYGLCRESKAMLTKAVIEKGDVANLNRELYFGID